MQYMPVKKLQTQNLKQRGRFYFFAKLEMLKIETSPLFLLFTVLILSLFSVAHAAPCYGTKLPQKFKIFMGIQSYSVFKRYPENGNGKLRSQQEFLLLSYGLLDWLSIDLKGGCGYIRQHSAGSDELDYPAFLGGGYGFRVKFYGQGDTKMVFGFQHISIHPHTISVEGVKHKAVSDDWQFSLLASYDLKRITPYIGTRWSRYDYIHWTNADRKLEKSDLGRSVGLIVGCDLPISEKFWLNFEGKLFDREALTGSMNYSF